MVSSVTPTSAATAAVAAIAAPATTAPQSVVRSSCNIVSSLFPSLPHLLQGVFFFGGSKYRRERRNLLGRDRSQRRENSAVDGEDMSVNVATRIGCEIDQQRCDIGGLAPALERDFLRQRIVDLWLVN